MSRWFNIHKLCTFSAISLSLVLVCKFQSKIAMCKKNIRKFANLHKSKIAAIPTITLCFLTIFNGFIQDFSENSQFKKLLIIKLKSYTPMRGFVWYYCNTTTNIDFKKMLKVGMRVVFGIMFWHTCSMKTLQEKNGGISKCCVGTSSSSSSSFTCVGTWVGGFESITSVKVIGKTGHHGD